MKTKLRLTALILIIVTGFTPRLRSQDLHDSLMYYYTKSDFPKAIVFSEQLVKNIRQLPGNQDTALPRAMNEMGFLYHRVGRYDSAEALLMESMLMFKNLFGSQGPDYGTALLNLGALYRDLGKFTEAENYFKEALAVYNKMYGPESREYTIALNNTGAFYILAGNFAAAEPLLLQALQNFKKLSGPTSNTVGIVSNNLAAIYRNLGNYKAAEATSKEAIAIYKKNDFTNTRDYGTAVVNLASLYMAMGKYAMADTLFKEGLAVRKKILGENHNDYLFVLNEMASLYKTTNRYAEAEKLYIEVAEARKKIIGQNHPDYSTSLTALGGLYVLTGNYPRAEELFKEGIRIDEAVYGPESNDLAKQLFNLSALYLTWNKHDQAKETLDKAIALEHKLLLSKLDFLSETELIAYTSNRGRNFELPYTYLWNTYSPAMVQTLYNSHLQLTGIALQNTNSLTRQSGDSIFRVRWNDYRFNRALLSRSLALPLNKRVINTDSLNKLANLQEKELLQRSAPFRNMKEKLATTWIDVKNNLQKSEAVIEFVQFHYNTTRNTDSILYAALLLNANDSIPVFIRLFTQHALENALQKFKYTSRNNVRGPVVAGSLTRQGNALYRLIWQPLMPYLKNIQTIYFSPDGLLNHISFAALPVDENKLLCDKYNLVQLTSSRELITRNRPLKQSPSSIVLFGGIDYNSHPNDARTIPKPDAYAYAFKEERGATVDSFRFLPGTLQEVNDIKNEMEKRKKTATIYLSERATEAAFRNIGGDTSPEVVHFATHGFTLADTNKSSAPGALFRLADDPLLRTGLVMAGGNKGWTGSSTAMEDDGILTGLEIASVPLRNTELAVLSACETGTGEFRGSEGVFGLQRAFKIAGVNYIMASLWQVPDKETREFMDTFYSQWLDGAGIQQSFLTTQKIMHKKYAPYYWAAFTLVH